MGCTQFCMFCIYHHLYHSNPWRQRLLSFPPLGRKLKPENLRNCPRSLVRNWWNWSATLSCSTPELGLEDLWPHGLMDPASVIPHLGVLQTSSFPTTHHTFLPKSQFGKGCPSPSPYPGFIPSQLQFHVPATLLPWDTDTRHPGQPLPEPQPLTTSSASLSLRSSLRQGRLFWVRNGAGRKKFHSSN